ncbi:MAG: PIN domain-containing protein [Chloroflexi bacterium]|nr:PIN domain-containing protein [Chloroflexota bacterium]
MVINGIVDTSIIVDDLRGYEPSKAWFKAQATQVLAITPVVWLETEGASNKLERDRAIRFLHRFHMEHPLPIDNEWAMEHFAEYFLSHSVQFPDVMIASVAVRLNIPLYTQNTRHFAPLSDIDERRPY